MPAKPRLRWVAPLGALTFLIACGGDDALDPCASPVGYSTVAAEVIQAYCLGCHAQALSGRFRNGAPVGLNFDRYEDVAPIASDVANAITSGIMPPANQTRPTPAERDVVSRWRTCGFLP